jgi:hypothetical protein
VKKSTVPPPRRSGTHLRRSVTHLWRSVPLGQMGMHELIESCLWLIWVKGLACLCLIVYLLSFLAVRHGEILPN